MVNISLAFMLRCGFSNYRFMAQHFYHTSTRRSILRFFVLFGFLATLVMIMGAVFLYYRGTVSSLKERSMVQTERISGSIKQEIENALFASEYLAKSISTIGGKRTQVNSLLQVLLLDNPHFEGVYTIWEPNEYDQADSAYMGLEGHDDTGRFMPYWTRDEFGSVTLQASLDYESSVLGTYYTVPKTTLQRAVVDPFLYASKGRDIMMVAAVSPIRYGRNFYGVTGVNISLATIQNVLNGLTSSDMNAAVYLLSANGTFLAHNSDLSLVGQNVADLKASSKDFLAELSKRQASVELQGQNIVAMVPMHFQGVEQTWFLSYSLPLEVVLSERGFFRFWLILILAILAVAFVNVTIYFFLKNKLRAVDLLVKDVANFSSGQSLIYSLEGDDDFSFLHERLRSQVQYMRQAEELILKASEGEYLSQMPLRTNNDSFAKKMNRMMQVLKEKQHNNTTELAKAQNERWVRNGVSKLNETLRRHYSNFDELAEVVLRVVIDYLGINQGGVFTLIEREQRKPYLELSAAYAYSKLKAAKRKVNLGDGIVGTCALEREITYLTEIPEDYPFITSGTGGARPSAIIVAPLIHENIVYGVLELASFVDFKPIEVEMIRQITEPIAASIASVKISANTSELLAAMERQREEMLAQERIMRTNLEKFEEAQQSASLLEDRLRRELESARIEILRLKTQSYSYDRRE